MGAIGRLLVTAFFAVAFGQSALDKLLDQEGNVSYFQDHFKASPFPAELIRPLFWTLTAIEATAGALCALGLVTFSFLRPGVGIAGLGVVVSGLALLSLLLGQRLAKDYAGAAVVAAYFAVDLLGIALFTVGH
jgi:hypothetical protein